ncbi:MAG: FAD-binding protein, partial [Burkholderiales bacterium]
MQRYSAGRALLRHDATIATLPSGLPFWDSIGSAAKWGNQNMKLNQPAEYEADVVIIGFGSAGGCAAIEARDHGAEVVILEKQPE